ncbi:MAG: response regulator [Actinobacteria bacterium]|nr:MAG: response regulator [Actinomycetota bacterium]
MGQLLREILTREGYKTEVVTSGRDAMKSALESPPKLIVLDLMLPDVDGLEITRQIRAIPRVSHIPILVVSARGEVSDRVEGLRRGVDDYMPKPFDVSELVARIQSHIRRASEERSINPLSGLPGNFKIYGFIDRKLAAAAKISVLYLDLDNFKAYNDYYGFAHGDDVILLLASILEQTLKEEGRENVDLLGHIGGDDFVIVTEPEHAAHYCEVIIGRFDERIPLLYHEKDRERGFIELRDRRGNPQVYPVMTISIGIVSNERRSFESHVDLAEVAAEVKNMAKGSSGSSCYFDRRSG